MSTDYEDSLSMDALNDRIAILEDNIRQLIEQAAAASGEQNESPALNRISRVTKRPAGRCSSAGPNVNSALTWSRSSFRGASSR